MQEDGFSQFNSINTWRSNEERFTDYTDQAESYILTSALAINKKNRKTETWMHNTKLQICLLLNFD